MESIYELRTDTITTDNGETISTYGITTLMIQESIPNIFFDKSAALDFISLCNKEKLEPIHLNCVIEDLLTK